MPFKKGLTTLTHDGVTLPLVEWAKRTGQSDACLRARIKLGWPIADALYRPRTGRGQPAFSEREKRQAERLNVAFNKLIHDVDHALRTFQLRMKATLKEPIWDRGRRQTSQKVVLTVCPPQRKTASN
jgi:hypothetical protein